MYMLALDCVMSTERSLNLWMTVYERGAHMNDNEGHAREDFSWMGSGTPDEGRHNQGTRMADA
jgi:hypothetical protein